MDPKIEKKELKIKLLWDLANALPPENHTNKLFRSFYLTECKKIGQRDANLPAVKFSPSVMCPKCCSSWSEGKFSLFPKQKRIHSQKAQKLVTALGSDPKSLTKKQRTRAKWLKKQISTNVEIKCGFCQKRTLQSLLKQKQPKVEKEEPQPVAIVPQKKTKKKKSKDKSAGLTLEKIISKQVASTDAKSGQAKKIKPPKAQKQNPKVEKLISKTQKQNSLLQLANMLKNRNPAGNTSKNNQLEKLLR